MLEVRFVFSGRECNDSVGDTKLNTNCNQLIRGRLRVV